MVRLSGVGLTMSIVTEQELKKHILALAAQGSRLYGSRVTDRLIGPGARRIRQYIMAAVLGKTLPQAKCGYNAVRDALFVRFEVPEGCLAEREDELQRILEEQ